MENVDQRKRQTSFLMTSSPEASVWSCMLHAGCSRTWRAGHSYRMPISHGSDEASICVVWRSSGIFAPINIFADSFEPLQKNASQYVCVSRSDMATLEVSDQRAAFEAEAAKLGVPLDAWSVFANCTPMIYVDNSSSMGDLMTDGSCRMDAARKIVLAIRPLLSVGGGVGILCLQSMDLRMPPTAKFVPCFSDDSVQQALAVKPAGNLTVWEFRFFLKMNFSREHRTHAIIVTDGADETWRGDVGDTICERPDPEQNRVTIVVCNDDPAATSYLSRLKSKPGITIVHVKTGVDVPYARICMGTALKKPRWAFFKKMIGKKC